jgi:hypothetical protein
MGWRFLQGLEKGIERLRREHMDFVDNIDLIPAVARHVFHIFSKLADLVDASVGGPVDLKHINRHALGDFLAGGATIARSGGGALLAVYRLGEYAGNRGLADTSGASKE